MKYTIPLSYDCLRNFVEKKKKIVCVAAFLHAWFGLCKFSCVPASRHASTVSQIKACPVPSCQSGLIRVNKFPNTGTIYKNSTKSIFSELRFQRHKRLLLLFNVIEFPIALGDWTGLVSVRDNKTILELFSSAAAKCFISYLEFM